MTDEPMSDEEAARLQSRPVEAVEVANALLIIGRALLAQSIAHVTLFETDDRERQRQAITDALDKGAEVIKLSSKIISGAPERPL